MKPTRTITIREYLPGYYEVECEGRVKTAHSRQQRDEAVNDFCSNGSDAGYVDGYVSGHARPWGEESD